MFSMTKQTARAAKHKGIAAKTALRRAQRAKTAKSSKERLYKNAVVDCGWGRLIFGNTFAENSEIVSVLAAEKPGERDVAFEVQEPHVLLALAPQQLFLDPSHTYRLQLSDALDIPPPPNLKIREITLSDVPAITRIYLARNMIPPRAKFFEKSYDCLRTPVLVAEDLGSGDVVGVVMGVDHIEVVGDVEQGASLWALAVDPQAVSPGIGIALTMGLVSLFKKRGRAFLDLSVMHDNEQAIALYEKLHFERVPIFCVKQKNLFNEKLFVGPDPEQDLNIYAQILVNEARRRGIGAETLDAEHGYFRLSQGGRSVTCRESLTELTSAVAMSRCDDKVVTRRVLTEAGLRMPAQAEADETGVIERFLSEYGSVVIKSAHGEQGRGVFVDIDNAEDAAQAIKSAEEVSETVIVEQFVRGEDLRIIVIGDEVVAGAIRLPPEVCGDGAKSVGELIARQSRRRAAATGGESRIPVDEETKRCIATKGYELSDILPAGEKLRVRKAANLHTGGTIHDVTENLHPDLRKAAITAAQALEIPVVGLDFIVPDPAGPDYYIIEANERPGLANHEPQPTAERFIDFLFPQTAAAAGSGINR
jgi:GNAT-family acetyltransferase (TIGR03103 family)